MTSQPTSEFNPADHFTPHEYARLQRGPLAREAARARTAAKRSAARGDTPSRQAKLRARADAATRAEQANADRLAALAITQEEAS